MMNKILISIVAALALTACVEDPAQVVARPGLHTCVHMDRCDEVEDGGTVVRQLTAAMNCAGNGGIYITAGCEGSFAWTHREQHAPGELPDFLTSANLTQPSAIWTSYTRN